MKACPICADRGVRVFDRRERVSILQNRLYETPEEARQAKAGTLEMAVCEACGFIFNAGFDQARLAYDPSYENDQSQSAVFQAHLDRRIERILDAVSDIARPHLVEPGCGQGDFLERLAAAAPGDLTATGFDPAYRGGRAGGSGDAIIHRRLFDETASAGLDNPPDAVISRHTIEHIADPGAFLGAIRRAAGTDRPVRVFLETPCAHWIIERLQFHDLFYEHCSIFTAASLHLAMERAGFTPTRIEHVFGGQYLWAEFLPGEPAIERPPVPRLDTQRWQDERARYVGEWQARIDEARRDGPVYLWGAGAKGVTFALLTDPEGTRLEGAVDVSPKKQGRFIPLTGLDVVAPAALPDTSFTTIVMHPNYRDEIASGLQSAGRRAKLLSLA